MAVSITTRAGKGAALTHAEMDTNWTNINAALMEVGARTIFLQPASPSGWTQDNTFNDKVLRLIDNTGIGADTGGSWTISGVTVDGHTLTINEIPPHIHSIYTYATSGSSGQLVEGTPSGTLTGSSSITTPTGGGGSHNHGITADGNWRPAYADAIVCTKD